MPIINKSKSKSQVKWVVLEMTGKGEEEAKNGILVDIISRISKIEKDDIYIPVVKTGGVVTFLIEGYIFIKSGYPNSNYYRLFESLYIDNSFVSFDPGSGLFFHNVISDEELKNMVNKAMCKGAVLSIGSKGRIKNGDFKGFEGEVLDIINLSEEGKVEKLERWVRAGCPDLRLVRRNRLREWVVLGCKKLKETTGIKYEKEMTYYVVMIKMRSVEILTVIDGFSLEGVK